MNATLGRQLYPSIVDFFLLVRREHPSLRFTSTSYFPEIHELETGVAAKGLPVVPMSEMARWSVADFNRFDVVMTVGASQTLARLMELPGLSARLVCLDLGFYHQLLAMDEGVFTRPDADRDPPARARNAVLGYSCQPRRKVAQDLTRAGFDARRFQWRWSDYLPVGLTYRNDCRASAQPFDVALLGTSGRDYDRIDSGCAPRLAGALPRHDGARPGARADADGDGPHRRVARGRGRLCAAARLVPLRPASDAPSRQNVLLSVVDALASGRPIVTNWHRGIQRLLRSAAPIRVDRPDAVAVLCSGPGASEAVPRDG